MTWQDELRQLDEELSAGRISAEDYRRRRDELVASAAGGGAVAPPPGGQQGPFPPPFRWEQAASSDATQVIPVVPAEGQPDQPPSSDATQVVRLPPAAASDATASDATTYVPPQAKQAAADADADRTRVVPGGVRQPPPGPSFPPQQGGPTGWSQPEHDSTPPWGMSDLPPLGSGASWIKQGPEVFESDGGSNTGKILAVVAAVVLLVGIAVGAYFLFGSSNKTSAQKAPPTTQHQTQTQSQPPSTPAKPPQDPLLAVLPGSTADTSKIQTFGDVDTLNPPYLTAEESSAYKGGNPGVARMGLSKDGGGNLALLLVVDEGSPEAAAQARDGLADLQGNYGFQPTTPQPGMRGATTDTAAGASPSVRRAHYASGKYVVRVEVNGANAGDVDQLFQQLINGELSKLPADG